MPQPLTIWCNASLPEPTLALLSTGVGPHRLVVSKKTAGNLSMTGPDDAMAAAEVAFGQPDPLQVMEHPKLKWVHITSAGYTRYDREDVRAALRRRGAALTNSSAVYADPCAQHVLAFMMSFARQLPASLQNQLGDRAWPSGPLRRNSFRLGSQSALILGFGAIARRLVELLAPFQMELTAVRKTVRGDEPIPTKRSDEVDALLPNVDHVIDILPSAPDSDGFMNAGRIARMKRGAFFYNIGRGTTVDQRALEAALRAGQLAGAYLDVTTPEPLPADDPLWTTPNCYVTAHTAGGHRDEYERLVRHFLENLRRFERGEPLADRVM